MQPWKMFIPWMWALHLVGAIWLSAGVLSSAVIFAQLKRTDPDLSSRAFGLRSAWRLMVVFVVPGVIFTGLLGFYLLHAFRIGFLPGWVKASTVVYFILLASILFGQVPALRRAARAAEASRIAGAATPELLQAQQNKLPMILTHINATMIFLLIFFMAFKPF